MTFARGQNYRSTATVTSSLLFYTGGGYLVNSFEPAIPELLYRGIACALIDTTGCYDTGGFLTTVHPDTGGPLPGVGIWHPPSATLATGYGEDPADSDAWADVDKLNSVKDYASAIQDIRSKAAVYGISPLQIGGCGGMGDSFQGAYGSAAATASLILGLGPDLADADAGDIRTQSTRLQAVYAANFQGLWTWYEQGVGGGNGLSGFQNFPDKAYDIETVLAPTFGDAPQGYQLAFSPLHLIGSSASQRALNGTGVKLYLYTGGYGQISAVDSWGKTAAGTDITLLTPQFTGNDSALTGKLPNVSGRFDAASATQAIRTVNKHTPHGPWTLIKRARDINSFHDTNSILVGDATTRGNASLFGATAAEFDSQTYEPDNLNDRITHICDWLEAALV